MFTDEIHRVCPLSFCVSFLRAQPGSRAWPSAGAVAPAMQAQIHFQFKNCASRWHQRCRSLNGNYGIDAVRIGNLPLQRRALSPFRGQLSASHACYQPDLLAPGSKHNGELKIYFKVEVWAGIAVSAFSALCDVPPLLFMKALSCCRSTLAAAVTHFPDGENLPSTGFELFCIAPVAGVGPTVLKCSLARRDCSAA